MWDWTFHSQRGARAACWYHDSQRSRCSLRAETAQAHISKLSCVGDNESHLQLPLFLFLQPRKQRTETAVSNQKGRVQPYTWAPLPTAQEPCIPPVGLHEMWFTRFQPVNRHIGGRRQGENKPQKAVSNPQPKWFETELWCNLSLQQISIF